MIDLIIRLSIVGVVISLLAGPLGSIVVWRRLAFFGDTIAHSALLAVSFSILLDLPSAILITGICFLFSLLLSASPLKSRVSFDTILAVLSHGSLALGIVMMSLMKAPSGRLTGLLFGDVLAISQQDVTIILALGATALGLLKLIWQKVLMILISEELAHTESINVKQTRLLLGLVLGLTIGILVQIVGVLLVTALLIIPAAATRNFAKSPLQMAVLTALCTATAYFSGGTLSYFYDVPMGAMIVVCALVIYAVGQLGHFKTTE